MTAINQQFEQSCRERFGWDESRFDMHGGQYLNGKTYALFQEWQSSRAALVVELPEPERNSMMIESHYDDGYESGFNNALSSVKQAITAAGVAYE